MKRNCFLPFIAAILVLGMGFTSCATKVPIKSVKMPTIDTTGIHRLAIKGFENKSGFNSSVTMPLANYLKQIAEMTITGTGKFTIVSPTDPNADGIFSGEITLLTSEDKQGTREVKDSKTGAVTKVPTYERNVKVEFSYSVISSRTNAPVGTVFKTGSRGSTADSYGELTSTLDLAKRIVDSQMKNLSKDVVPYIVSDNRKLAKETSKDKVLKQKMKDVLVLVKNGYYEEAIKQYDLISSESGSVAAKINAGLLREAIASDIAATAELAALFDDKDGAAEKAAKQAVNKLHLTLPSGTNISIMKTSSTNSNKLDYVVDQMTKTIIEAKNITLVDRSNQALIDAEQRFQASGAVDDESAVSIGHQLGVKYIVLCWIGGEQSLRRLYTKVLNIETAQIEYQDDVEI